MKITINEEIIDIHSGINLSESQLANVEKWINALFSENYQQGRDFLRLNDKYCCLGVACDSLQIDHMPIAVNLAVVYDAENNVLSPTVSKKLGLFDRAGQAANSQEKLTVLNDTGTSFYNIASMLVEDLKTNCYGFFVQSESSSLRDTIDSLNKHLKSQS